MKKLIALFDTHIPHNIPLDPVFSFIEDWEPDTVVLGGDNHDFAALSFWVSDQSRNLDGGTIKQNHYELNERLLRPIESAAPAAEKIYLEGNHENRIAIACAQRPDFRGYIELERNIPFNWKIIPMNVPYRPTPHCVITHGVHRGKGAMVHHARQAVQMYHTTIFYGHHHTKQSFMDVSPIDVKHYYLGESVACLCDKNPDFMKNRPNAWTHGFLIMYIDEESGFFYPFQIPIINNKFIAEGRLYQ